MMDVRVTAICPREPFNIAPAKALIFAGGMVSADWSGREYCESIESCIAHEKRIKKWRREWKFALIEEGNPDWHDLFDTLV